VPLTLSGNVRDILEQVCAAALAGGSAELSDIVKRRSIRAPAKGASRGDVDFGVACERAGRGLTALPSDRSYEASWSF
jgi:hypothetical protein